MVGGASLSEQPPTWMFLLPAEKPTLFLMAVPLRILDQQQATNGLKQSSQGCWLMLVAGYPCLAYSSDLSLLADQLSALGGQLDSCTDHDFFGTQHSLGHPGIAGCCLRINSCGRPTAGSICHPRWFFGTQDDPLDHRGGNTTANPRLEIEGNEHWSRAVSQIKTSPLHVEKNNYITTDGVYGTRPRIFE